jgi:hypothetical protein
MMIGRSPLLAGQHRRFHDRLPLVAEIDGRRDAQHRVLRAQPDQHEKADLEVDVVVEAAQMVGEKRAQDSERHRRHHRAGQRPRLVLRGEHEKHDDEAEDERDARRAAGLLLLEREPRPRETCNRAAARLSPPTPSSLIASPEL